jgi:hypothetical protein
MEQHQARVLQLEDEQLVVVEVHHPLVRDLVTQLPVQHGLSFRLMVATV